MNEITSTGPVVPDPAQLELFDQAHETVTDDSTDIVDSPRSITPLIRSPTEEIPSGEILNASSLHRKSRELVQKSFQKKLNEPSEP